MQAKTEAIVRMDDRDDRKDREAGELLQFILTRKTGNEGKNPQVSSTNNESMFLGEGPLF